MVSDNHVYSAEESRAVIIEEMSGFLERGLRRIYPSWGSATPPMGATVSGSPRLVLGIAGRNVMQVSNGTDLSECMLRRGDLCVIHGNSWNHPLHVHAKTFLTIDFKPDRIRYYLRKAIGPGSTPALTWLYWVERGPDQISKHLIGSCEQVLPNKKRKGFLQQLSNCLIEQSFEELTRTRSDHVHSEEWLLISDWLDEHLHEEISRDKVARIIGVHPNHVSRIFKKWVDQSFVDYVSEQRIQRAGVLLQQSSLQINEIAVRSGFSSPEYFCTVFRRKTGQTPKEYRRGNIS